MGMDVKGSVLSVFQRTSRASSGRTE